MAISRGEYIEKVLKGFNMDKTKPITTALGGHFKLLRELGAKTHEEKVEMENVSYSSAIGSLMYAIMSTWLDIAHIMRIVSSFMSTLKRSIGKL